MPHEYEGHYKKKHPPSTQVSAEIETGVRQATTNGKISCGGAHSLAKQLNRPPVEIGIAADLQESKITDCQLGLFGHDPASETVQKPLAEIDATLDSFIQNALQDGRLSCIDAWTIADRLGISRQEMGQACERKKIKINQCQIGAF